MNKDTFKGQWRQIKGEVKQQWGRLTDSHLSEIEGSYDKLVGKIQESYGYQRDQAEREVNNFLSRHPEMAPAGESLE